MYIILFMYYNSYIRKYFQTHVAAYGGITVLYVVLKIILLQKQ